MIALPAGLYFSRLGPESAVVTAREVLSGRMPLGHLRGRAALSPSAQVAEHTIRERTGLDAIDAIEQVSETTTPDGSVAVDMRIAGRDYRVLIRQGPPEPTFGHGCIVDSAVTWHRWIVDSVEERSPSDR